MSYRAETMICDSCHHEGSRHIVSLAQTRLVAMVTWWTKVLKHGNLKIRSWPQSSKEKAQAYQSSTNPSSWKRTALRLERIRIARNRYSIWTDPAGRRRPNSWARETTTSANSFWFEILWCRWTFWFPLTSDQVWKILELSSTFLRWIHLEFDVSAFGMAATSCWRAPSSPQSISWAAGTCTSPSPATTMNSNSTMTRTVATNTNIPRERCYGQTTSHQHHQNDCQSQQFTLKLLHTRNGHTQSRFDVSKQSHFAFLHHHIKNHRVL